MALVYTGLEKKTEVGNRKQNLEIGKNQGQKTQTGTGIQLGKFRQVEKVPAKKVGVDKVQKRTV